eukprot:5755048-Pleurochrysis_carterae.AAC.1
MEPIRCERAVDVQRVSDDGTLDMALVLHRVLLGRPCRAHGPHKGAGVLELAHACSFDQTQQTESH